ncbi:MAG: PAS domain S-box protein [Ignavibacteria bacterium]|jgi:PAS domain S-box-containing protein|nr:PAS domain S-box protein [Ignavibacteria bacterium]
MQKRDEIRDFLEKLENSRSFNILIAVFTGLIFVLDLGHHKGTIIWILYVLPLTGIIWKLKKPEYVYLLTFFYSALIMIGLLLKPAVLPFEVLLANRLLGIFVLVTITYFLVKRKETSEKIRERENQLINALRYFPQPVMLRAEDEEVIMINDAWTEASGYLLEDIPTISEWASKAYKDRQYAMIASISEVFNKKGKVSFGEHIVYSKKGEKRIWDISAAQFGYLPDGRRAVITTAVDITERKRYEEAVKESEERFRKTFEFASAGIAHTLPDGTWLRMNERYCELLGYSQSELQNLSYLDITHPDDKQKELENKKKLLSGELRYFSMEKRYIRKDGSIQWVLLNCSLASEFSTNLVYYVSVVEDLSHHKQVEHELELRRIRAEQLAAISKALNEVEIDPQAVIESGVRYASEFLEDPAGIRLISDDGSFSPYSSVYHSDGEVMRVLKELATGVEQYAEEGIIGQVIRRGSSILVGDINQRINSKVEAGTEFRSYIEKLEAGSLLAVPLKVDRKVYGVLVVLRKRVSPGFSTEDVDFVEEIAGRIAQRIANARLYNEKLQEIEIRRRTEEMLKRSNSDLEQFAYVASHDLQEPIRMIRSYVQLLEKRYRDRLDKKAEDYMGFISDGALRMQQLVSDLLQYSRITTKAQVFESVDCSLVLADVLTDLKIRIAEENALVEFKDLPVVTGEKTQIRQLFQNLIQNALKFKGEKRPEVHIGAERMGSYWQFYVSDNGIGIEKEFFERIFIIFQRLHEREKYPGTGIGLAMCKKIVERHSGKIWVESEPGHGTTFYFTLPA